ncbi:nucleolar protein 56-like [Physella acuta]|uniref:nucleolar protein 56-like n=1 Tax=Physella acuta TaxID=109671 RepID=UPI0027DD3BA3|nr:nucleolar protein 56-like [Physella acuta]
MILYSYSYYTSRKKILAYMKENRYGLIFHSTFIGRAGAKNKRRISRYLANKCTIASRVDNFSDIPTSEIGQRLKQQVDDRLKFYETGENPANNIDVMKIAVSEAEEAKQKVLKAHRKQERKEKKQAKEVEENGEYEPVKKKKKKKSKEENDESVVNEVDTSVGSELDTTVDGKKKTKNYQKNERKKQDITKLSTSLNLCR